MLQCSLGGPRVVVGQVGAAAASSHRKNALHLSRPDVPPAVAKHRGDRCLAFALHSPTCLAPTCLSAAHPESSTEAEHGRSQKYQQPGTR